MMNGPDPLAIRADKAAVRLQVVARHSRDRGARQARAVDHRDRRRRDVVPLERPAEGSAAVHRGAAPPDPACPVH